MWEMAKRYGHYDMDTLREAVEGISQGAKSIGPPHSPIPQELSAPTRVN